MRAATRAPTATPPQEIRFCRAPDGVRIAYAKHGTGPTLVIATCWLSHLQFDWESPVWRHFAPIPVTASEGRHQGRGNLADAHGVNC